MPTGAMLEIDGTFGEGGGQILRSALALSMVSGRPFCIRGIRGNRPKPGLRRQHLTAVRAAATICGAAVEGDRLDSRELTFVPGAVRPGAYRFSIGTAGSTALVLQTILPPLLCAEGESMVVLEGGTHNPGAPPFDFLEKAFIPLIARMGPRITLRLDRAGFYPVGGGQMTVHIQPATHLTPLHLLERGAIQRCRCTATVASLPLHIARREVRAVCEALRWPAEYCEVRELSGCGIGNIVTIEVHCANVSEVFSAVGSRGVPAEAVAADAATQARRYLEAGVPVGEHLADQLLLPLALAGEGSFVTSALTPHATTNIEVIRRFLDVETAVSQRDQRQWMVQVRRKG